MDLDVDTVEKRSTLFDGYDPSRAWDEMLTALGDPRTTYKAVHHTLRAMTSTALTERVETLARTYLDQGVTFDQRDGPGRGHGGHPGAGADPAC